MWNGETESSGTPAQTEDYTIVTPEVALEMAVSQRDTLKSERDNLASRLARLEARYTNASEILANMVEHEDLTESYTQLDTDQVIELCEALNVDVTKEIEVTFQVKVYLQVRKGVSKDDIEYNLSSYLDVSVDSTETGVEVTGFDFD